MDPPKSPMESQTSDPSEVSGRTDYTVHYDGYGRQQEIPIDDHDEWYLRPSDGRISKASVQSFEELSKSGEQKVPWKRVGKPKCKTPWIIQLLYWTYESILNPDFKKRQTFADRNQLYLRWLPSCFAMLFLLCIPKNLERDLLYQGEYDPIRYHESPSTGASVKKSPGDESEGEERHSLLGNYGHPANDIELEGALCRSPLLVQRSIDTHDIDAERQLGANIEYVFVSYTRKQFLVATDTEISGWNITEEERQYYRQIAPQDRKTLQSYGVRAARKAGVAAFWLDF
ncbi:hypothetical protein IWX50DRAFT_659317 [Phyllosticta citricarpa]